MTGQHSLILSLSKDIVRGLRQAQPERGWGI
jgi:hypothetical protein